MDDTIKKFALQNAVKFNGKANLNAVIGKVFSELKDLDKDKIIERAKKIVEHVNSLVLDKQKEELAKYDIKEEKKEENKELPELPNLKGKVIMRLAPFPSGSLHIGNARPFVINDEYVKRYKGKLLLIIDDTIGSKEKVINKEAYDLIPDGLKWLNINFDKKIIYKSDRLNIYYRYAEELIKKGKAYVCRCKAEKLRENRAKGLECSCRSKNAVENLKDWKKMFKEKEGSSVLRLKTNMQDKNPAFRDRVLFRISKRKHPKVGNKYSVWPMLEFSWAIDDHLLGITHIIRGKELMIESEMERYIWDVFKWKYAEILHTGLLQIEGVKLSKSKSAEEVRKGKYFGWDDPRTWSLQSLERRGFKAEAIRNFCLNFGLNQNEVKVPVEMLYDENRKLVEKNNRYVFVANPKKIKIKYAVPMKAKIARHPDYPERGFTMFDVKDEFYIADKLEENKVYRLMHLFYFMNKSFLSEEYDESLNAKMIHWLPVSKDLIDVEVLMDNGEIIKGLGEKELLKIKEDEVVQFYRFGFVRLNKKSKKKLSFWFAHR